MSKKVIGTGVVIVVGVGLWFVLGSMKEPQTYHVDGASLEDDVSESIELVVNPQLIGNTATVAKVRLIEPGYVVVREAFGNKLGQILEVSEYLNTGVHTDVEISLLDIPNDSADVIAVLYKDDGDKGFSSTLDTIVSLRGVPVARSFTTGTSVLSDMFADETDLSLIGEESITYVTYTDDGYSPEIIEIKLGDTVVFVNESSRDMWAASDPHPAHTNLPTFDQFGFGKPGEQYQYTFDQIGVWQYHDHINPSAIGTITVTERSDEGSAVMKLQKNEQGYFETPSDQFSLLIAEPDVTVINVHIPYGGEIAGTDAFVPYNDTKALLAALPADKTAPVALYCRSGSMSAAAAKAVVTAGYENVYDLSGGMNAYRDSDREVIVKEN